jgi:AcrR family transcriptional regulator
MSDSAPSARSGRRKGDSTPPVARARAAALPAEERRSAIIAATVPLLLAHGAAVRTRQIAEAAGIAEGTIFRVFPDKESLIEAAIEAAIDPEPVEAALRGIDAGLPLEERLVEAVDILQRRVVDVWNLMSAVGATPFSAKRRSPPSLAGLAAVFEPDRARLRRDPVAAAHLLRGLTIGASHPAMNVDGPLKPAEIVSILLDGVRIPSERGSPS